MHYNNHENGVYIYVSDGQTMLCVAGDVNAHIGVVETGDEESLGRLGRGTRNREG